MTKLQKNILFNIIGQIITVISGFIAYKFIYAELGGEVLGIIVFSMMISGLLMSVINMGISKTTVREIAGNVEHDFQYVVKLTQLFSLFYWVVYGVVVTLFIIYSYKITVSWLVIENLSIEVAHQLLLIVGTTTLLVIPKGFYTSICVGLQRMDISNLIDVAITVVQQVGIVVMLVNHSSIIEIAYWIGFTNIARIIVYILALSVIYDAAGMKLSFSGTVISRVKSYTSKMALLSILLLVHKQLDKVLISKFLVVSVLGFYGLAFNAVNKMALVTGSVAQAVFPSFAELDSNEDKEKLIRQFNLVQEMLIVGMLPVFAAIPFFSVPVFTFVLDREIALMLEVPLILLAISFYLNATIRTMSVYLTAVGRPKYIILSNILSLIFVTPVTVYLIIEHQLVGAALAWVIYYLFGIVFIFPRAFREEFESGYSVWLKSVLLSQLGLILTFVPCWFIIIERSETNIYNLTWFYMISLLVYLFYSLNTVSDDLRMYVIDKLGVIDKFIIRKTGAI